MQVWYESWVFLKLFCNFINFGRILCKLSRNYKILALPSQRDKILQWKKKTNKWDDIYIDIPSDTITKLYQAKKCNYIQISDGCGLYHLGNDICGFDVPLFKIEQQIRIRTKIHTKKNKKGFCNLSVTVACQPKNIKELIPSKYSLDNKDKLPPILIFNQ